MNNTRIRQQVRVTSAVGHQIMMALLFSENMARGAIPIARLWAGSGNTQRRRITGLCVAASAVSRNARTLISHHSGEYGQHINQETPGAPCLLSSSGRAMLFLCPMWLNLPRMSDIGLFQPLYADTRRCVL
jgi:hypothetical protein